MSLLKKEPVSIRATPEASCLRIDDFDLMAPFLVSVVSRGDLWTYVSSNGSLCAGRESEDKGIFPYVTDDKIHDSYAITGPLTLIQLEKGPIWEPFTPHAAKMQRGERSLSKSALGDQLTFREHLASEGLCFSYTWQAAEPYGLVRRVRIENLGAESRRLKLLDGILNIMPPQIDVRLQAARSTLVDGYKQAELLPNSRMAVYSTASGITDRPFPMENLLANCAWSCGLPEATVCLAADAPDYIRNGAPIPESHTSKGQRGAYWLHAEIELAAGEAREWMFVLDCAVDAAEIVKRVTELETAGGSGKQKVTAAMTRNHQELHELLASADAFQVSNHAPTSLHHTANVLFNCMRGGVFINHYALQGEDFQAHVKAANQKLYAITRGDLEGLQGWLSYDVCRSHIEALGNPDLLRLFLEYLPITFSRRHGDPSRPWNKFMIHTHESDGSPRLSYQGNWRDIFQNWEALCLSYPKFLEHVVVKFLNTSTMDGYNPYRVFNGGFDWEEVDLEDPFSGIGYWGDHQIVYLLRLLEGLAAQDPGSLDQWLEEPIFVFANVPYRIKPLAEILKNPRATLTFDKTLSDTLRVQHRDDGSDGLLLKTTDGTIHKATLVEKLLIPALVKLSNLVPGGGIWMNTERPEWNDANNALVGNGLSMVTAGHLLRYLEFCHAWWAKKDPNSELSLGDPVAEFVDNLLNTFDPAENDARGCTTDTRLRAQTVLALGRAGQIYRERVYRADFGGRQGIPLKNLLDLLENAAVWLRLTLNTAKRTDGLMDSYNLIRYDNPNESMEVTPLYEMLEGQVSALSANYLNSKEAIELVDILFDSSLYTAERNSFLLYPDRKLPDFLNKGLISEAELTGSALLQHLLEHGNSQLVIQDSASRVRFAPTLENMDALNECLHMLCGDPALSPLVKKETTLIRSIYERVFNHHAFTGRSGGMYSYEGLGCIYWHQVAKLLLAVQECFFKESEASKPDRSTLKALGVRYYKIRSGIGFNKTAQQFGAFPTDPYSHTPAHSGAQQPGMTGQTKEEILTRFGELGIRVRSGSVYLNFQLLQQNEFLKAPCSFDTRHVDGSSEKLELQAGELAFTYCQVPFVYTLVSNTEQPQITIINETGAAETHTGTELPIATYKHIIGRTGRIRHVNVSVPQSLLIF
jgi:hypothetical protein